MARNTQPRAGATVTVACKLPHGVILRRFVMREREELVMGGGVRTIREAVDTGESFTINGCAREPGKMPARRGASGAPIDGSIVQMLDTGFALTPGVPADLWADWLEQNKASPMVVNGLIFAHGQQASVKAMGKENEARRSGLEPIDPSRPGPGVQEADEMKKRRTGMALSA